MRALVTDEGNGHNRSALAAVRALGSAGHEVVVATSGSHSLAAVSRHTDRVVALSAAGASGYGAAVRSVAASRGCLAIFPSSDTAVVALGLPGAKLLDKELLAERVTSAGWQPIPQHTLAGRADLIRHADDLPVPAVVKVVARDAEASFETRFVASADELRRLAVPDRPLVAQPWLIDPVEAIAGVTWNGRVVAAVQQRYLRTWPAPCGTASAAVTVDVDRSTVERLEALLAEHDGIFQAQFVGPHVVDLNPRVYGSLPLAVAAGVNLPAIVCRLTAGETVTPMWGRAGVRYRWLEGDVRHVARAVRHHDLSPREAIAALWPHRGTSHSVESFRDPRPLLRRVRTAVARR